MSKTPEFRRPGQPRPAESKNNANYVFSSRNKTDLMMIDYIKKLVRIRNVELKLENSIHRYKVRVYGRYDDLTKSLNPFYYSDWKKRHRKDIGFKHIGMKDRPDILMVYITKYQIT